MEETIKYITVSIPYIKCIGNHKEIIRNHALAKLAGSNFCPQCGKSLI